MSDFTRAGDTVPAIIMKKVEEAGGKETPEGLTRDCPYCKRKLVPIQIANRWLPRKCHCERERESLAARHTSRQQEDAHKLKASCDRCYTWLGEDLSALKRKTFQTYNREAFPAAYDRLQRFVSQKDEWGEPLIPQTNFIIFGGFGTGKTHIMAATLNALCDLGVPCRFMMGQELFDRISECFSTKVDHTPYLDEASRCPVLGIDDTDKIYIPERLRETEDNFQAKTLFRILNYRYLKGLPTLLTTNSMDITLYISGAALSRLQESGELLQMEGDDYRKKVVRIVR